jgi:hypothetical protein
VTKPRAGCPINLGSIPARDNVYLFYKMFMPAQDPTKSFVFIGYRGLFPGINLYEPCVLYIGRAHRYSPEILFYIYFLTNIRTEFFKHAAHSPFFFSLKCRLFHNATFLVRVLFAFYVQGVLKFKCQIPVPKG